MDDEETNELALLLLAAERDVITLAESLMTLPAVHPSLPRAAAFFETLSAAARSTISQIDDSLMSETQGCIKYMHTHKVRRALEHAAAKDCHK
jgi:hypothetical protein